MLFAPCLLRCFTCFAQSEYTHFCSRLHCLVRLQALPVVRRLKLTKLTAQYYSACLEVGPHRCLAHAHARSSYVGSHLGLSNHHFRFGDVQWVRPTRQVLQRTMPNASIIFCSPSRMVRDRSFRPPPNPFPLKMPL